MNICWDGKGLANVLIECNQQSYSTTLSYLSEPLVDLLEGLISISPNCVCNDELKSKVSFEWYGEPCIDRWTLELIDDGKIIIQIEHLDL